MNSAGENTTLVGLHGGLDTASLQAAKAPVPTPESAANSLKNNSFSEVYANQTQADIAPDATPANTLGGMSATTDIPLNKSQLVLWQALDDSGNPLPVAEGESLPQLPLSEDGQQISLTVGSTSSHSGGDSGELQATMAAADAVPLKGTNKGSTSSSSVMDGVALEGTEPGEHSKESSLSASLLTAEQPVVAKAAEQAAHTLPAANNTQEATKMTTATGVATVVPGAQGVASQQGRSVGGDKFISGQASNTQGIVENSTRIEISSTNNNLAQGQQPVVQDSVAETIKPNTVAKQDALMSSTAFANQLRSLANDKVVGDKSDPAISNSPLLQPASTSGLNSTQVTRQEAAQVYQHNGSTSFQLSVPVEVGKPGWSDTVIQRVMWMSSQNINQAEVALDPPELGPLQVRISTQGDSTSVTFTSSHSAVRDALDQGLPRLREMMDNQGLDLVNVDVSDQQHQQQAESESSLADGSSAHSSANEAPAAEQEQQESPISPSTGSLNLVDHYV